MTRMTKLSRANSSSGRWNVNTLNSIRMVAGSMAAIMLDLALQFDQVESDFVDGWQHASMMPAWLQLSGAVANKASQIGIASRDRLLR